MGKKEERAISWGVPMAEKLFYPLKSEMNWSLTSYILKRLE
jgi:hypothetical protein